MRKRAVSSAVWRQDFAPLPRDEGLWESPPGFLGPQRVRIHWCRKSKLDLRPLQADGSTGSAEAPGASFPPRWTPRRGLSISRQRPHLPVLLRRDLAAAAWALPEVCPDPCCVSATSRANGGPGGGAGRPLGWVWLPFPGRLLCGGGMSATVKPLEDQELFLKGVTRLLGIRERADSREKDTRRSASWFPRDTCCQRLRLRCLRQKDNLKSPRARMLPAGR